MEVMKKVLVLCLILTVVFSGFSNNVAEVDNDVDDVIDVGTVVDDVNDVDSDVGDVREVYDDVVDVIEGIHGGQHQV